MLLHCNVACIYENVLLLSMARWYNVFLTFRRQWHVYSTLYRQCDVDSIMMRRVAGVAMFTGWLPNPGTK